MESTSASQAEIDARLARFHKSHHGRDLWPDIPVETFRAVEADLARVASAVLRGSREPVELPQRPGVSVRDLGVAASLAGVGALLGYWCESGAVHAPADVAALLALQLDHGRRRTAKLRVQLERVLPAFAERGIDVLVLKGAHTAYVYYPEPGTRISSDIDVLVPPDAWPSAQETLRALGFRESKEIDDPEQDSWSLPEARVVRSLDFTHADSAWSVDLHRTLGRSPFAGLTTTLPTPDVRTAAVWREYSRPVHVLSQPLLLAYLALHASRHFYGITQARLIELVLVAQRDFAGRPERWRELDELLARTRAARFVFPALDLAERLVPGTMDPLVLQRIADAAPGRLRRLVRGTAPSSAQQLHPFPGLRERFVWIGTPKEALGALAWLVWPHRGMRPTVSPDALRARWRRIGRTVERVVRARVPKRATGVSTHRLLKPLRPMLSRTLRARSGNRVYAGPFKGMLMPESAHVAMRLHQLLGTFEMELRPAFERLQTVPFRTIVNIGAAGGYYAVGLARRFPAAHVIAFEILPEQQEQLRSLAEANDVAARLVVRDACTPESLRRALADAEPPVLLVADIEGEERSLFDPEAVQRLGRSVVIVETHDDQLPGTTEELCRRFAPTHEITTYVPRPRTRADLPPDIASGPVGWMLTTLVDEQRAATQRWLVCVPLRDSRGT